MKSIVFSDIDGTLLNDALEISPETLEAVKTLQQRQIPFIPVSARGPSGIRPILSAYHFQCGMVCYSGALILDERGTVLFHQGIDWKQAAEILKVAERFGSACTWNLYTPKRWIVKDPTDRRVQREEQIVHARAEKGTIADISEPVSKILLMVEPDMMPLVEQSMKASIAECSIVRSNSALLEIMAHGVDKAGAVKRMAELHGVSLEDAVAFGDNFNDEAMLCAVGHGFLMGNAPQALKTRFQQHTADNNHDGIAAALRNLGLI